MATLPASAPACKAVGHVEGTQLSPVSAAQPPRPAVVTPSPVPAPQTIDVMATAHAWYTSFDATTASVQQWWADTPDDDAEKRQTAHRVARQLVLAHSPIGRAAANVADLADRLDHAMRDFLATDARGCVAKALAAAGLHDDGQDEDSWQRGTFDTFAELAHGYAYLVGQLAAEFRQTGGRLGEVAATGVVPVYRTAADAV